MTYPFEREEWLAARREQEAESLPASTSKPVYPYEEPEEGDR